MSDFAVAVAELAQDSARFADAAETTRSIGTTVVGSVSACVDDWGWWTDVQPLITTCMTRTKEQTDAGADQLSVTSDTLAAVRATYVQEEIDHVHAATGLS